MKFSFSYLMKYYKRFLLYHTWRKWTRIDTSQRIWPYACPVDDPMFFKHMQPAKWWSKTGTRTVDKMEQRGGREEMQDDCLVGDASSHCLLPLSYWHPKAPPNPTLFVSLCHVQDIAREDECWCNFVQYITHESFTYIIYIHLYAFVILPHLCTFHHMGTALSP